MTERQQSDFRAHVGKLGKQPVAAGAQGMADDAHRAPLSHYDSILEDMEESAAGNTSINVARETSELQNVFQRGETLAEIIKKTKVGK